MARRLLGSDLAIFAIDSSNPATSGAASTSYLTTIRQCQIELSFEAQENRAVKDAVRYNEPVIEDWRVSFSAAQESHSALWALVGGSVWFTVSTGSSAKGGTTFGSTGVQGLLRMGNADVSDGLQEISFEIVPQGESLADAIAASS